MTGQAGLIVTVLRPAALIMRSLRKIYGLGRRFLGSGRAVEYLSTPDCRLQMMALEQTFYAAFACPEKGGRDGAGVADADGRLSAGVPVAVSSALNSYRCAPR